MNNNFWKELKKPVFTLAPMEDVTDTVFREIVLQVSDPECLHVIYSEFTSTDGLCHEVGGPKVKHRLRINESERRLLQQKNIKIVAQIWGNKPEKFSQAAKIICDEDQFDGIDINMGCPAKKIVKQGGCSALINQPNMAKEIILATREASTIPVSIKTRIGINKVITEEWINHLLETKPAVITIHGRTQKQQSEGMADWNEVRKAVKLRDSLKSEVLIHGNGDVLSYTDGLKKAKEYMVDGIMIGKGIFFNPWFFNKTDTVKSPEEKISLLWKHTMLFGQTWGDQKHFAILKRFFKIYTSDFYGASNLRARIMETKNIGEVRKVLENCDYKISL